MSKVSSVEQNNSLSWIPHFMTRWVTSHFCSPSHEVRKGNYWIRHCLSVCLSVRPFTSNSVSLMVTNVSSWSNIRHQANILCPINVRTNVYSTALNSSFPGYMSQNLISYTSYADISSMGLFSYFLTCHVYIVCPLWVCSPWNVCLSALYVPPGHLDPWYLSLPLKLSSPVHIDTSMFSNVK